MKTEERSLKKLTVILPRKLGSTNGTAVSADYFTGFKRFQFPLPKKKKPFSNHSVIQTGQSSNSKNDDGPPFICSICIESRTANDSFNIKGCCHSYCKNCIAKYVASKLEENITSVPCPEPICGRSLEPEHCPGILPRDVFARWGNSLSKAVILEAEKFQELYKAESCEDIMLLKLAQEKKWRRCPRCNYFVEKISGCRTINCRCGYAFCYDCGTPLFPNSHGCPKCYSTYSLLG